jgi:hypothetical protein
MGSSSYLQTNFLGGEWAPEVQGRSDTDAYKTGLNRSQNYMPIEQGSLLRRQGFQFVGHTKAGAPGRLTGFDLTGNPLQLEFTDGWVRFISGSNFLSNGAPSNILSISSANPAVVTTSAAHGFSTNDTVFFFLQAVAAIPSTLFNRQFVITVLSGTTFSIKDALTGLGIDGSTIGWNAPLGAGTYTVTRIAELASPYTGGDWAKLTFVQDEKSIIIFHPKYATRVITQVATGFGFALGLYAYLDGPYLDLNDTTTTLTPSAASGTITVTASSVVGINDGQGFLSTDVGRFIRMYNAPAAWTPGFDYPIGSQVTYVDGNVYVAINDHNADGGGVVPTNIDHWALLAFLPFWCWMIITVVTDTTHVTATLQPSTSTKNATLFNILPTLQWHLGLFRNPTSHPTCGTYREGRLWVTGVVVNRVDGSVSNHYDQFSPTGDDGTVGDGNAISGVVKANENNPIQWLADDDAGLLFGTTTSEWKIKASNLDDPLTPNSSTPRRLTKYGSLIGTVPLIAHKMHLFIQRMGRKIIELGHPGAEGGSLYTAMEVTNLSLTGSHLSVGGLAEIVFCNEPKPTVWARRNDGRLLGLTYIRTAEKLVAGWHQHPLGTGRKVESLSVGPSIDQLTDRLYLVTNDPATNVRWIEMMTDVFDDNKLDNEMFFTDAGMTPSSAKVATVAGEGFDGVRVYGFWPMIGKTVSATFGGVDAGDAVVAADGHVDFPFTATFTLAFLQSLPVQLGYQARIDGTTPSLAPDESGKLLCYNTTGSGISGRSAAHINYAAGRVMFLRTNLNSTDSIPVFPTDDHGTQLQDVSQATVYSGGAGLIYDANGGGTMMDYQSFMYVQKTLGNNPHIAKLDPTTFVQTGAEITLDLVFSNPGAMVPLKGSGASTPNFMLVTALTSRHVQVFNTDTMSSTARVSQDVDENRCVCCTGPQNNGHAIGYVLGRGQFNLGGETTPLGFYVVDIPAAGGTMVKVGTISPAQIDATWTHMDGQSGLVFDQTDGNVMFLVHTNDAVTNNSYLVKINPVTAAVMWASPVNNSADSYADAAMSSSVITAGQFCWMSPGLVAGKLRVYIFNTLNGTSTFTDFNTISAPAAQSFDSRTGCITFFGSYGPTGSTPPVKIGDYFAVPNTSYSNRWGRLGIIPPAPISSIPPFYSVSTAVGATYTSQGQMLRPDHGNDAGARNGPAFGKIRRNHWWAMLVNRTQAISVGTDFGATLHPIKLSKTGGTSLAQPALYSGVLTDTLTDDYSKEGMLAWQQTRPLPGQILVVAGYIETQDK